MTTTPRTFLTAGSRALLVGCHGAEHAGEEQLHGDRGSQQAFGVDDLAKLTA